MVKGFSYFGKNSWARRIFEKCISLSFDLRLKTLEKLTRLIAWASCRASFIVADRTQFVYIAIAGTFRVITIEVVTWPDFQFTRHWIFSFNIYPILGLITLLTNNARMIPGISRAIWNRINCRRGTLAFLCAPWFWAAVPFFRTFVTMIARTKCGPTTITPAISWRMNPFL